MKERMKKCGRNIKEGWKGLNRRLMLKYDVRRIIDKKMGRMTLKEGK